jgi:hypothetical protein
MADDRAMNKNEFKVTEFTVTETNNSTGEERPVSVVRVKVTFARIAPEDPIVFFLEPPEALELADKLRVTALKLGR